MTSYTDEQVEACRKWCEENGYERVESMLHSLLADRTRLQAKVDAASSVLKRYQDARVFSNPHTRQVARSIAEEIDSARAKKGDV